MINVTVITNNDTFFEYYADSVFNALDQYVDSELLSKTRFSTTRYFWEKIKDSTADMQTKIKLINGFCKRRSYKIKRVISNGTTAYPVTITLNIPQAVIYKQDAITGAYVPMLQSNTLEFYSGNTAKFLISTKEAYTLDSFVVMYSNGNIIPKTDGLYSYDETTKVLSVLKNISTPILITINQVSAQ